MAFSAPTDELKHFTEALRKARRSNNGKLFTAFTLSTSAFALGTAMHRSWKDWTDGRQYHVSIDEDDEAYALIQEALLPLVQEKATRSLNVTAVRNHERKYSRGVRSALARRRKAGDLLPTVSPDARRTTAMSMHTYHDNERFQTVTIAGHQVKFAVETSKPRSGSDRGGETPGGRSNKVFRSVPRLVFNCPGLEARDAVLKWMDGVISSYEDDNSGNRVFSASAWGEWRRMPTLIRDLTTVVLQEGIVEDLVQDLQSFFDLEERYIELGLPWHRGYMLHGPPGTGKTSVAKALAGHFGLDVYYLPLSDMQKDSDFSSYLSSVSDRGVLLLEDIDVLKATHDDREHETAMGGLSLAGLLNALDGIVTPHGLITIYTTNNLESLDSALRRTGRSDRTIHIGHANHDQAVRIANMITGMDVDPASIPDVPMYTAPSDIIEAAKPYLDSPHKSLEAIQAFLAKGE